MDLKDQVQNINRSLLDLDAAFLVSTMFQEQKDREKVFINLLGILKRRWSKDIDSAENDTFNNGEEFISLNVNRSGIYDSLPEAIFHDFPKLKNDSGNEMAKESRKQKLVEKEARLFFRPAENELFYQRAQLAGVENRFFNNIFSHFINNDSHDFWLTATEVPGKFLEKFNILLPFANNISGNLTLAAHCLEYLLEESITIEITNEQQFFNDTIEPFLNTFKLGSSKLGNDSILATQIDNYIGRVNFRIGPLTKMSLKDYLSGGDAYVLLDCFFDYFIPLEFETEWTIILDEDRSSFVLNDEVENANAYLNYSTLI